MKSLFKLSAILLAVSVGFVGVANAAQLEWKSFKYEPGVAANAKIFPGGDANNALLGALTTEPHAGDYVVVNGVTYNYATDDQKKMLFNAVGRESLKAVRLKGAAGNDYSFVEREVRAPVAKVNELKAALGGAGFIILAQ